MKCQCSTCNTKPQSHHCRGQALVFLHKTADDRSPLSKSKKKLSDRLKQRFAHGSGNIGKSILSNRQSVRCRTNARLEFFEHRSGVILRIGHQLKVFPQNIGIDHQRPHGSRTLFAKHGREVLRLQLFRYFDLNGLQNVQNRFWSIGLHILLQLRRVKTDVAESCSLQIGHAAALHHRAHKRIDAGGCHLCLCAGTDSSRCQCSRLLFGQTGHLTQGTISQKHLADLLGLGCV